VRRSLVVLIGLALSLAAASPVPLAQQDAANVDDQQRAVFLQRFARGYFPGRSGQIFVVPREGDIFTRDTPADAFMHGSPWRYDTDIPLLFVGPGVVRGVEIGGPATQQDVAVTLAAVLGTAMPATVTGRDLFAMSPAMKELAAAAGRRETPRPRAILLLVIDAMRRDYFSRHAKDMPTLTALRKRGTWFSQARINYVPTTTGAGHASIAAGTEPRFHGIPGNNLFDRSTRKRYDLLARYNPRDLMALTFADIWQLETGGRAIVIAQGSSSHASTALAGHGACQVGGSRVFQAGYDETAGVWRGNAECFTLLPEVAALDVKSIYPADGMWMRHKVDTPQEIRRTALFARFEAEAITAAIASQPIGRDTVTDLVLLNMKVPDYVAHKYGPESGELVATLGELDRQIARIMQALEAKVGADYLLALTADHGMPGEPPAGRGRFYGPDIITLVHKQFDPEMKALIPYYEPENSQMFVDADRLSALQLTLGDIAAFLRKQPFLYAVFTEADVQRAAATLQ
jgi:hypothetical protein